MQSQSKIVNNGNNKKNNNKIHKSSTTTATTTTTTNTTTTASNQQQLLQPTRPRVIKCKEPLIKFRFYLDIEDHQLTKRIEEIIQSLGGLQEFFLNEHITHFITDKKTTTTTNNITNTTNTTTTTPITTTNCKDNNNPKTPTTPLLLSVESLLDESKNVCTTTTTTAAASPLYATTSSNTTTTPSKSLLGTKKQQTRADAILNRARQQQQQQQQHHQQKEQTQRQQQQQQQQYNYKIWNVEYALKFFKKVQHELKDYIQPSPTQQKLNTKTTTNIKNKLTKLNNECSSSSFNNIIPLKGNFIKIEAIKPTNCRPYHQVFRKPIADWPKIDLTSDDGAFRLTPLNKSTHQKPNNNKNNNNNVKMTRKSRSRTSTTAVVNNTTNTPTNKQKTATVTPTPTNRTSNCRQLKESSGVDNNKQCGVCEICKIEYDTLTIHLKTKDHEYFAKNPQNFLALDTLIQATADVKKFLTADEEVAGVEVVDDVDIKVNNKETSNLNELGKMEVEQEHQQQQQQQQEELLLDESVQQQDALDGTPTLREKSKRANKGKHYSEKFQQKSISSSPTNNNNNNNNNNNTNNNNNNNNNNITVYNNKTKSKSKEKKLPVSSPIRAILPMSNLYKVVDNKCKMKTESTSEIAPTSLIVKFKKVRTTELVRLNGEAETFLFPKQRSSSDLPTDVDRHTSSDKLSQSSLSLNSSNECQRFPKAPIQSELQLKPRKTRLKLNELSPPSAAAAIVAASASIRLPAATRKSSRTATAIVTAATTSSRRLLAAVAAVKKSRTRQQVIVKKSIRLAEANSKLNASIKVEPQIEDVDPIVKLKDRMGDITDNTNIKLQSNATTTTATTPTATTITTTTTTTPTTTKTRIRSIKRPSIYDFRDSLRLKEQLYAFERIPSSDLWHKVFLRQDNCTEEYFTYYGKTKYQKLPYELQAIPFQTNDCCLLCQLANKDTTMPNKEKENVVEDNVKNQKMLNTIKKEQMEQEITTNSSTSSSTPYKHKKLHLLQRYRQEQAALLKQQQKEKDTEREKEKEGIVDVAEEVEEEIRIKASEPHLIRERTNSTASSCSTNTSIQSNTKKPYRNKHLNLELPPRKSPREHASTLALVCGIIKQRQESKTNSEVDEPRTGTSTPIPSITPTIETTTTIIPSSKPATTTTTTTTTNPSTCVTPIEEMRFATEISENVKRMRRGQNKYDHSPNYVLNTNRRLTTSNKRSTIQTTKTRTTTTTSSRVVAVRKPKQPKGMTEIEIENKALEEINMHLNGLKENVVKLAADINAFLENTNNNAINELEEDIDLETPLTSATDEINSYTDCFGSDFDLYELLNDNNTNKTILPTNIKMGKQHFSLYNNFALNNYYKKRKYQKSNRTGWPKIQKRKPPASAVNTATTTTTTTQKKPQSVVITPPDSEADDIAKSLMKDETQIITAQPVAEQIDNSKVVDVDEREKELVGEVEMEVEVEEEEEEVEDEEDEEEVEDEECIEADDEAEAEMAVADLTEHDFEEIDFEPKHKRLRRNNSSLGKALANCFRPLTDDLELEEEATTMTTATSTPSTHMLRGLRRTPQMNLTNCVSPSEKADNSDIFTVSSDGLDTDLDLSNQHSKGACSLNGDESIVSCLNHTTPNSKRKYDISKYVPNPAANTCAAEAATAAAKSLAIAQFLKKEVRVTCRRIRAPFRRFRYRR